MAANLRNEMPAVTAFIDDMRAALGAEMINAAIKAGIAGQQTFHASENGHEVGTRIPYDANKAVSLSDINLGPMNVKAAKAESRKG